MLISWILICICLTVGSYYSGIYEDNHGKERIEIGKRLVLNSEIARNYRCFRSDMIGLMARMEEERRRVYCSKRDQTYLQKRDDLIQKPNRNTAWKIKVRDIHLEIP